MKYIGEDSHPKIRQATAMLKKDTAYQTQMDNIIMYLSQGLCSFFAKSAIKHESDRKWFEKGPVGSTA
jgi:hypothetical protein